MEGAQGRDAGGGGGGGGGVGGGGRDVQRPKPLVVSWLLHLDNQGTCIT